jgi:hypothetical protein
MTAGYRAKPDPAVAHAPRDRHEYRAAARDLVARGYQLPSIASALNLSLGSVTELLQERGLPVVKRARR